MSDPFCEQQMWREAMDTSLFITEPICAATGLLMTAVAAVPNVKCEKDKDRTPGICFIACKSSLIVVSVGTVIGHAFSEDASFNNRLCDWASIVIMCTNIVILYASRLDLDEAWYTFIVFIILLWTLGLTVAEDDKTFDTLSIGEMGTQNGLTTMLNTVLLIPLAFILLYATIYCFRPSDTIPLWLAIAFSVAIWLTNAYMCKTVAALAVLHAVYHLTIAYAFIYAACLGATIGQSEWKFQLSEWGWPQVMRINPEVE
jgi:hypothetical protein